MFCRNCGSEVDSKAIACPKCGVAPSNSSSFCGNCGTATNPNQAVCLKCGGMLGSPNSSSSEQKSKIAAGLLAIFLGGLGIHNFYLGFNGKGAAQLVMTLSFTCCGVPILFLIPILGIAGILLVVFPGIACIWGLIEGIMIFTGAINKDAKGVPLRD